MPRNSSGTYTLPAGNPVVPNTLIESVWANTTCADIGQSLTDSLDRFGRGTMLAPLKIFDGTVAAPGLSFGSEGSTGIYRTGAGTWNLAILGVAVALLTASGATFSQPVTFAGGATVAGPVLFPNGTAAAPSISFTSNTDLGIYRGGANILSFASAGAEQFRIASTQIRSNQPHLFADGAEAAAAIAAVTDPNTGIYWEPGNAGILRFASQGVLRMSMASTGLIMVTPVQLADGDAVNPSLRFAADTDLGFYRVSANIMGVAAVGVESFRFDAGSNFFYIGDVGGGVSGRFSVNTWRYNTAATATIQVDPLPADGTSNATFQLFRNTNTTGTVQVLFGQGNATTGVGHALYCGLGGLSGLGAAISRLGTRTVIGTGVDDGTNALQVAGNTRITEGATSGLSPNSSADTLVLDSTGNAGLSLLSNAAAATLRMAFGTLDSVIDGRIDYARATRALTFFAGASLGFTLSATALTVDAATAFNATNATISGTFNSTGAFQRNGDITRFVSANQTLASATVTRTVAHGGPRVPDLFYWTLKCMTAEHGYAVNDEIYLSTNDIGSTTRQYQFMANATNIVCQYITSGGDPPAIRSTAGALVNVTVANWRWVAHALWL